MNMQAWYDLEREAGRDVRIRRTVEELVSAHKRDVFQVAADGVNDPHLGTAFGVSPGEPRHRDAEGRKRSSKKFHNLGDFPVPFGIFGVDLWLYGLTPKEGFSPWDS